MNQTAAGLPRSARMARMARMARRMVGAIAVAAMAVGLAACGPGHAAPAKTRSQSNQQPAGY
ncbi:MAG: hypothetical protein M0030_14185 [Actinomycetota bacterium]|nr:hypothetical protein [Actinomycetota bacterium]